MKNPESKSGLKFWSAGVLIAVLCFGLAIAFGWQKMHFGQCSRPENTKVVASGPTLVSAPGPDSGAPKHLTPAVTDASFDQDVLKSDVPVLVDFWAPWCGPCRMLAPVIDEICVEYKGRLKVVKLNTDENPKTAQAYHIRGIPSLYIFKNGEVVEQVVGAVPKETLVQAIEAKLK